MNDKAVGNEKNHDFKKEGKKMGEEFNVQYVYSGGYRFLYQDMWEFYLKYYGTSKLIKRRAISVLLCISVVITTWSVCEDIGFDKVISIKKDTYCIWGVLLSIIFAAVVERIGVFLFLRKIKRKLKNINVDKLTLVFDDLKIKILKLDGSSGEFDYRYLVEKSDEFILAGVLPIKKSELKNEEIKFLSIKCNIRTRLGTQ